MKKFLLGVVVFLTGCTSKTEQPVKTETKTEIDSKKEEVKKLDDVKHDDKK